MRSNVLALWVLYALVFLALGAWVPGVYVSGVLGALIASAVLGLANMLIRPILIFFTLPVTLVTFGAFLLIVNTLVLLLVDVLVSGLAFSSFWVALFSALVFWAIGVVVNHHLGKR